MYQSNNQVHGAFISAIKTLEKIPIYWKLKEIRIQNLFHGKFKGTNYKKCTCDDDYDKVLTYQYLFPIFPSEGQSYLGEYNVMPFFYLIMMNDSKAFPVVELIEIPLVYHEIYFKNIDKEKIDSKLSGLGNSFIASYKKITKENISQELKGIRKNVILKIFNLTKPDATFLFSVFSNIPESILLSDNTGYMNALSMEHENVPWSLQSTKIIPIKLQNELFSFTLSCWAFSKQEV
ncbi:MAG: hypothetical protein V4591_06285 [Bdellovibrionota bacterium]